MDLRGIWSEQESRENFWRKIHQVWLRLKSLTLYWRKSNLSSSPLWMDNQWRKNVKPIVFIAIITINIIIIIIIVIITINFITILVPNVLWLTICEWSTMWMEMRVMTFHKSRQGKRGGFCVFPEYCKRQILDLLTRPYFLSKAGEKSYKKSVESILCGVCALKSTRPPKIAVESEKYSTKWKVSLKNTFLTIRTVWEVETIGFDRNMMDRVVWGDFSLVSIFPFCQTFSQIFYGHSSDWVLGMSTVN